MSPSANGPLPGRGSDAASAQAVRSFSATSEHIAAQTVNLGDLQLFGLARRTEDLWSVLTVAAAGASVAPNIPPAAWADTLCSRMWQGHGPRFTPDALTVPAYAAAPQRALYDIRTYVGAPIVIPADGRLFGTLCGVGPVPMADRRAREVGDYLQGLVQAQADMLGIEVERELHRVDHAREHDWDTALGSADAVTGLPNRLGWRLLLGREDARADRLADSLGVLVVDVPGASHARQQRRAAALLVQACGDARVAHVGPARFAVLCAGWSSSSVAALRTRIAEEFRLAKLSATVGWAMRRHPDLAPASSISAESRNGAEAAWRSAELGLPSGRLSAV